MSCEAGGASGRATVAPQASYSAAAQVVRLGGYPQSVTDRRSGHDWASGRTASTSRPCANGLAGLVSEARQSRHVTYQPDLAVPRAAEDVDAFTATAEGGLKHVVLLSGRGEEGARL